MDRNKKLRIGRLTITLVIMAVLFLGNGFSWGFWVATGESPMTLLQQGESYTPPNLESVSLGELTEVLAEDNTSEQEYREGFNCIDYAWGVMRALQWEGIASGIVAITFEDGTSHAILVVPTENGGWQFIDPQSDALVSPQIGGYYNGKKIVKVEVMVVEWVDIVEFTNNPAFGGEG